jgi:predicted ferric reductase
MTGDDSANAMNARALAHVGWPLLIALILTPLLLWAGMLPLHDRFATTYLTLSSLGRIVGIEAMVLFCLNIILTSRLKVLENIFGGLNKLFIAHHIIGGVALCVLLVHPLLFSLRTMTISSHDAALVLLPFTTNWATTYGVLALWLFVTLMILTLYVKLPYRFWLFTHKFLGLVLFGIILHVLLGVNDIAAYFPLRAFCWVLLGLASAAFIYRTLLPWLFVKRYNYTISNVTTPSKGVIRITMQPQGRALRFTSGQFIFVSFRAAHFSHEWHPFSISSNSHDQGLTITVKSLGAYTGNLVKLAPSMVGTPVGIEGAYGRFSFGNFVRKRQIWVAGGIGVTPFLSMMADVQPGYSVDFYYSVKTAEELLDWPLMYEISARSQGAVRVIPVITDRDGYLSAERIAQFSGDLRQSDILLCGPPPMMHALHDGLAKLGLRKSQIHSEEFAMS